MIAVADGLGFTCRVYKPQKNTPVKAVLFFVSSFKTPATFYLPFIRTLNRGGFVVYAYDYESRPLLRTMPANWVKFSQALTKDIQHRLAAEVTAEDPKSYGIVGISVGAVLAIHAAKMIPSLKKVMLVNPYGSNAEQVWSHRSLKLMRQALESQNITRAQAREIFGELEPTANIHHLADKDILMFANRYNHVIRYDNTLILIEALRSKNIPFELVTMNVPRHSLANIYALGKQKQWLNFFNS